MLGFTTMLKNVPRLFAKSAHSKNVLLCVHLPAGAFFQEKMPKMILPCVHLPSGALFSTEMPKMILPCVHFPAGAFFRTKMFSEKMCFLIYEIDIKIVKHL